VHTKRARPTRLRWLILAVVAGCLLMGTGSAHPVDRISAGALGNLEYQEGTFEQAVARYGQPDSTREFDGCVPTLEGRWGQDLKIFFDTSDDNTAFIGIVKNRRIPLASGDFAVFHTRKGLRVRDSVERLQRLYPNAEGSRAPGGRQWTLGGDEGGGRFLTARTVHGTVSRLISGLSC
jgi:hypothetical protein